MTNNNVNELPRPRAGDRVYTLARAGLAAVPIVGGSATELFSLVLAPPLERRRDEWLRELHERLMKLEAHAAGFKLEDLGRNEVFVSAALQATQVALRSHEREKLDALKNALTNIAVGAAPSDDWQQMFLRFIDEFTASHIRVLAFLWNPKVLLQRSGRTGGEFTTPQGALGQMYSNFEAERDFYQQILTDLSAKGLVNVTMLETRMYDVGMVTPTGKAFLDFIEAPRGL